MGYKPVDQKPVESDDKDGNNITGWKYHGFATVDESGPVDDDPEKLVEHESNTWHLQGYFSEQPEIKDPDKGCGIYGGGSWYIQGTEANFRVGYPEAQDQTVLCTDAQKPGEDEKDDDIKFSISVGLGPISAGPSIAYYSSVEYDPQPYEYTDWKFDYGVDGEELPTGQKDTVGVQWDFEAADIEKDVREMDVNLSQSYSFEVIHHCAGPEVIYSDTPDIDIERTIEIMKDN
ncbi:hypothetical protein C453_03574 [Haloferax elongans ATCC BAA-1513]|uniref:Uncharacterized protein n=1 Tax=Haloferax elongans ATCC BAA-1513 TaxID=1230453 RepID=M0HWA1_HALEO|nr:hypothetical protein [Haloferax elongans]ELZ87399.1 hypothetical protein C453_03574 [Haloferax elongans ATCC BAA-1513]